MSLVEVKVPDIGDFKAVEIIEMLVKVGDTIKAEQSLVTVESDKASMEIPSSHAGVITELKVKLGDSIAEGHTLLVIDTASATNATPTTQTDAPAVAPSAVAASVVTTAAPAAEVVQPTTAPTVEVAPAAIASSSTPTVPAAELDANIANIIKTHASPSVRKFARELGVDLQHVRGSGRKGRIVHEDVQAYVKGVIAQVTSGVSANAKQDMKQAMNGSGLNLLPWPSLDFKKFGETTLEALPRIKKLSGPNLHRNWVMIPHVTQFEQADITELEAFRVTMNSQQAKAKSPLKLTMLAFVVKAAVTALKKFPSFNASLDATGEHLILKQYYNIGFAADTPNGLVVPVIKQADQKGLWQIAQELGDLSAQARDGKLKPTDMQGATFTISSLGGIGGTAFTPIVNAPEVAILGLSKSQMQPVWNGSEFVPRLMLPLSLSYDHRVIDGAQGARFAVYLAQLLQDLRQCML
jgi:pyruvate dehydrogenase E2 component (dihydrolipoamide acetyltransferase)